MKKTVPVAILVRVSTAKQETDRQVHDLQEVAMASGWDVVEVVQEQVSGNAADTDRAGIERVMELARAGSIRKSWFTKCRVLLAAIRPRTGLSRIWRRWESPSIGTHSGLRPC